MFGEAEKEVHVLDGLSRGSFDEVVDDGDDDGAVLEAVFGDGDEAVVGPADVARVRDAGALAEDADEALVGVALLELFAEGRGGGAPGELDVDGGLHPARHGHEVWREGDAHRRARGVAQALLNLRHVPVPRHAVRVQPFRHFAVQESLLGRAPRARDARLGVDDEVLRLDEPSLEERHERELDRGGVAPRVGHHPRLRHRRARHLRQPVHHLLLQLHRRVLAPVPLGVHRWIPQPKVRRKVHHLDALRKRRHNLLRSAVREAAKGGVDVVPRDVANLHERRDVPHAPREVRVDALERTARAALRRQRRNLHTGVLRQQPHHLRPRVPGGAEHGHLRRLCRRRRRGSRRPRPAGQLGAALSSGTLP
mmetsp:Transcript_31527/g.102723  ORF Transcript_31527/g.102723 Transcript_31527/m.102723 type:complete len:366 (-) Transcript_31527:55-1152(-)